MEDLARDARKDTQSFINENKEQIKEFYEKGSFERNYNDSFLTDTIKKWNGEILINGEAVSKGLAIQEVAQFIQNIKKITGAVAFSTSVEYLRYGRTMNLNLPELPEDLEDESMEDYLEDEGFTLYASTNKK